MAEQSNLEVDDNLKWPGLFVQCIWCNVFFCFMDAVQIVDAVITLYEFTNV